MGEVIRRGADAERIASHVRKAYNNALGRKGEVAATAESRLGPSVVALNVAETILKTATEAEAAAWIPVEVCNGTADVAVGRVRDAMWNALGRPKQSAALDGVFPGGIETYTAGDPCGQPVLMQVLESRIRTGSAPQWSDAQKNGWIAEIEAERVPFAAAVEAHRPADAALTVAQAGFRAASRSARTKLVAFKRELKNLGLSEGQIHEIIPDEPKPREGDAQETTATAEAAT